MSQQHERQRALGEAAALMRKALEELEARPGISLETLVVAAEAATQAATLVEGARRGWRQELLAQQLLPGRAYRVVARNLEDGLAVFAGGREFIGVRSKFGMRRLESEFLADGGSFSTVTLLSTKARAEVPDGVLLTTHLGSVCETCGAAMRWTGPPSSAAWAHDGPDDHPAQPMSRENDALRAWLEALLAASGAAE